jgi:hypothetical protein
VGEKAQALAERSRAADFDDIARQVDALHQQAVALRGKLLAIDVQIRPN